MKTYIFGIGGTGARVMKSLAMLLSAGVEINTDEIVPIFIDPDESAANLTQAVSLMREYVYIHEKFKFTSETTSRFFKTPIVELIPNFRLELSNTRDAKFKQYMGFESLDTANQALAYMLFSEANLESDMEVGFKGNPNIGSVVLNQFSQSSGFFEFANNFKQGDRIFIISSIFGGTGASGFPLLLKNLRSINSSLPNSGLIKNAPIGAITVLPYFNIHQDGESVIDSSTFASKAKAALEYYDKNISGNNSLNAFYYIADNGANALYEYSEGGTTQKNKAHVIELLSALAIIDFCSLADNNVQSMDGRAINPIFKEFGVMRDDANMIFSTFYDEVREVLQKPMTQFTLFCKYLNEQLPASKDRAWTKGKRPFDDNFFKSTFFKTHFTDLKEAYIQWLAEMEQNTRGFTPFHLDVMKKDVFGLVKGIVPKKTYFSLKNNYDLFDDCLSRIQPKISYNLTTEERFIELFYQATDKIVTDKKLN